MLVLTIGGTLGADPDVRDVGGKTVLNLRVAVQGYDYKSKEKTTTWVKVSMWGDRGAKLAEFLSKGDRVMASGEGRLYTHEGKAYLELTASNIGIMSSASRQETAAPKTRMFTSPKKQVEDDLPF